MPPNFKIKKYLEEIEHLCNPLHIYCRLVGCGYNKYKSITLCRYYEICLYKFFCILLDFIYQFIKKGKK